MSTEPNVPVTLSPFIDETLIENTLLKMQKYNSSLTISENLKNLDNATRLSILPKMK